jgi:hypothetical protein
LLATPIAARSLTCFQRRQDPLRQSAIGSEKGLAHGRNNLSVGEHVALHREPRLNKVARVLDAAPSGVGSRPPIGGAAPVDPGVASERRSCR